MIVPNVYTVSLRMGWETKTSFVAREQVRRKYSYSAVGSSVRREMETGNMGITSRLKKLQKERLIVARLGFPDQAMEIDGHIDKIRGDLRVSKWLHPPPGIAYLVHVCGKKTWDSCGLIVAVVEGFLVLVKVSGFRSCLSKTFLSQRGFSLSR